MNNDENNNFYMEFAYYKLIIINIYIMSYEFLSLMYAYLFYLYLSLVVSYDTCWRLIIDFKMQITQFQALSNRSVVRCNSKCVMVVDGGTTLKNPKV